MLYTFDIFKALTVRTACALFRHCQRRNDASVSHLKELAFSRQRVALGVEETKTKLERYYFALHELAFPNHVLSRKADLPRTGKRDQNKISDSRICF